MKMILEITMMMTIIKRDKKMVRIKKEKKL